MRSLFAKIVGWFVLTMLIIMAASFVINVLTYNPESVRAAPLSTTLNLELTDARRAWETGGREALRTELDQLRALSYAQETILTDANGRDLVSGETRADLLREALRGRRFPFSGRGATFARFSADGRYCFFLIIGPKTLLLANLRPAYLVVLGLAVLLCYALAYHLTAPLRPLRRALDRFGRGEFNARADAGRRDELGELASAFNRMATHIQTLLAAERRLLLDVSHELRSPLARLSVAVELARCGESGSLPLDRIQKEADRLNELIGEMLEVTRLEGDPASRKTDRVQLNELIGGLVDDCCIEAQARGCSLNLDPPPAVAIEGDSELLRRAIENVMRNAIRYAPPDSAVEVSLSNGSGRARVRVRDYGPGVPEEALPHLFDPFYRVDPDRNRGSGGVGLGLSIARRAVEVHHGTLRASNAAPGLLVEIELPV